MGVEPNEGSLTAPIAFKAEFITRKFLNPLISL